jgi:hypothetical protein
MLRKSNLNFFVFFFFCVLSFSYLFLNCAGSKQNNRQDSIETLPTSMDSVKLPDWWDQPRDPNYLFAVSTATSKDMQLSIDKAKHSALADIAAQMENHLSGLSKRFDEEVGLAQDSELLTQFTQASKSIVDQTITGSRIEKQEIRKEPDNIYRAFVLVSMPIGTANIALMEKIKQNRLMYTQFRNTEIFKELETEVEKYRKFKEERESQLNQF